MLSSSVPTSRRTPSLRFRSVRSLAIALAAASSLGWLASGSCRASYCSEDCDPCLKSCRCSSSICYQSQATFEATHALTEYTLDEPADEAGPRRTFRDVVGLSIPRAGGPAIPTEADCVTFARGVLDVNARLFPPPPRARARADSSDRAATTSDFVLDAALPFEGRWVVQFHRDVARDVVSFLFDERGTLLEIDHASLN